MSGALAAVGSQLLPFYYSDGTLVTSANGEPDDAALFRVYDTPNDGIVWQLMTQHLAPRETVDVWLEGSNDGSDSFRWRLARVKANPRGEINAFGTVRVGAPPGLHSGSFTNPRCAANLVIRAASGETLQTAYFPAF